MRHSHKDRMKLSSVGILTAILAMANSGYVVAQAKLVIEEVIVTAQKREQSLNDVGITVNAFTQEDLKVNRIQTSQDIAANTANLHVVNQFSTSLPTYHVRGIGLNDFASNNTSTVGMYADGIFQTSPSMHGFQLFDIERVEVLKGPQGILYGRNTTGGAINFIAAKPTREEDGYISADFGRFNEGRVEAAYSNAITDNLAGRAAVVYDFGDGYVDNRFTGHDLHGKDKLAARLLLEWTPTERATILFNLHGGRDRSDAGMTQIQPLLDPAGLAPLPPVFLPQCPPLVAGQQFDFASTPGRCVDPLGYADVDDDLYAGDYDLEPRQDDEFIGGAATVNWDINDNYNFALITGVESYDRFNQEDLDSSPYPVIHVNFRDEIFQFTNEARLNYSDEKWNWTAGLYYSYDRIESNNDDQCLDDNPTVPVPPFCVLGEYRQDVKQKSNNVAVFFHSEYAFADTWNFTFGGRYSYETKDFDLLLQAPAFFLGVSGGTFAGPVSNPVDNKSFNSFSWKVGLDKAVGDDMLVYATVSEGFKTGGFSGGFSFGGPELLAPFEDESLLAYEIGLKSSWIDNRLRFNAAAFYYDYEDIQLFSSFTSAAGASIQVLNNGANAEIFGLEGELLFWITDALELSAVIGWLDQELKDAPVDPSQPPVPGIPGPPDINGNKLANTPDVNFSTAAAYHWKLNNGAVALRTKFHYQSKSYFETFNQPFLSEDGYWTMDASLRYISENGKYEIGVWGQNLWEEERVTFGFPFAASGLNFVTPNQPRRYGVSLRYNF